jgi:hypothetical protein
MLAGTLMALPALAGNTVIADRTVVAERLLAETHQQLTAPVGQGLGQARAAAAFRPGQIAVSHGTGDAQLHERGKHAAGRLAATAHLLARLAGARP